MADTTFIDNDLSLSNRIVAAWLNDVNNLRYGAGSSARGSALLEYISTATAAVARTVQSRLFDVVSALDFGVVGDGVTNDAAAMQLALTAAAGKTLLIPSGRTYKINSALSRPANTWVIGYGATLDFSGAGNVVCLNCVGGGGAVLGLTLTGAGNAAYNAAGIGIQCLGTAASPPTYVNGPLIRDCTISEVSAYGVLYQYTNGGLIGFNRISGCGYAGVGGLSTNDLDVIGNTISEISPGTGGDCYGIAVDRLETGNETAQPRSFRCDIGFNTVSGVAATGGNNGQGIDTHGGVDFTIVGNTVTSCEVGIFVTSSSIAGAAALAAKRVVVADNTIEGGTSWLGYGIQVSGALIAGPAVAEYAFGIVVEGNSINGHGIAADGTSGAIRLQGTKNLIVKGNSLRNPACYGIVLNTENLGFSIEGNTVVNPHDGTFAVPGCLGVLGINNSGQIAGNVFRYDSADVSGLGANRAVESIRVGAALTGLDIEIGKCTLLGIDATHLTLTLNTTTGINSGDMVVQRGTAVLAAGTAAVAFAKRMPTAGIYITLTGGTGEMFSWSLKAATGFTITSSVGASTASVDWVART